MSFLNVFDSLFFFKFSDSKRTYEFDESKLKSMFDKTSNSKNTSNENGQFQFQFFNNKEPITLPVPSTFN